MELPGGPLVPPEPQPSGEELPVAEAGHALGGDGQPPGEGASREGIAYRRTAHARADDSDVPFTLL